MNVRIRTALIAAVILVPACGAQEDTGGPGPTNETGPAEIAAFTMLVRDTETDSTFSFEGVSCDGLSGPYVVTITLEGDSDGATTAPLPLHGGIAGTLRWSMEVAGTETGTVTGRLQVKLSLLGDSGTMVVRGFITPDDGSGRRLRVMERDIPVRVATGTCPNI